MPLVGHMELCISGIDKYGYACSVIHNHTWIMFISLVTSYVMLFQS